MFISAPIFLFSFFQCSVHHRNLHSFPTRRSSDLLKLPPAKLIDDTVSVAPFIDSTPFSSRFNRSEEHTSELQSLRHLVCRLLLEKKKNNHQRILYWTP